MKIKELNVRKNLFDWSINYLDYFREIVSPLKYLGINTFSYYKITKKLKAFYFSNDKNWHLKHYISSDGMKGLGRCVLFADPKYNLEKIIYTGNPNYDLFAPNGVMNGNEMFNNNLWNALCFYSKNDDDSYESFNFFGGNNYTNLPEIFIRYEYKFRKFISYFKGKFLIIANDIDEKKMINVIIDNNLIIRDKFIKPNISSEFKTKLIIKDQEINLTPNQYKIIECLNKGVMLKNIPEFTGIEYHNIEPTLRSLRLKLNIENNKSLLSEIKKSLYNDL